MDSTLSDSAPLAVTATEVFDSIVRGGLAAPSDVRFRPKHITNFRHFLRS